MRENVFFFSSNKPFIRVSQTGTSVLCPVNLNKKIQYSRVITVIPWSIISLSLLTVMMILNLRFNNDHVTYIYIYTMHIWKARHSFPMFVKAHNRVSFNENMNTHTMCWRIQFFHTVRVIFSCYCVKSVRFLFSGVHHAVCCVTASRFTCSTRTWCYLTELSQVGNSLATSAQPGLAPNQGLILTFLLSRHCG